MVRVLKEIGFGSTGSLAGFVTVLLALLMTLALISALVFVCADGPSKEGKDSGNTYGSGGCGGAGCGGGGCGGGCGG
ncbi:hypothetical protein CsatB_021973 [Cannabis sativa]